MGVPLDKVLCAEPLLRREGDFKDRCEEEEDAREVVAGTQSFIALVKSLSVFSKPVCICLEIVGNCCKRSLNVLTSLFWVDPGLESSCFEGSPV